MGYTPAFDSIYTGTLYGKWPTAAVWASLIPLIDAKGEINLAPEAIAGMTGWPLELLLQGLAALEQPDPRSRSKAEEGRRLVRLDPERDWGWRVVNHGVYREKARLMAKSQREVENGSNRSRMDDRRSPPETAEDRRSPPLTASDPLSYSDSDKNPPTPLAGGAPRKRGSRIPDPFFVTSEMRTWAKSETPDVDVTAATAEFVDYWRGVPGQKGCKLDWIATWRNRLREIQAREKTRKPKANGRASEWT